MRLVDDYTVPKPNIHEIAFACAYMGQELLNPPTVEGWHTGREWIDSGALVERVNFAADQIGDTSKPGVRRLIQRVMALGPTIKAEELVDSCLDLVGPIQVSETRRRDLLSYTEQGSTEQNGEIRCGTPEEKQAFDGLVGGLLRLIVSSREFQFA